MTRIDRAFCTPEWEQEHVTPHLQALSSSTSDHCPLLLTPLNLPRFQPRFRFESFCIAMPGFHETVQQAWGRDINQNLTPLTVLHTKLGRAAKALRKWAKSLVPQGKISLAICREVVSRLEQAQESRQLSQGECNLLGTLKNRILGLAAIEKSRAQQRSQLTWLRLGDANTKLFHLVANKRKQRNYIYTLVGEGRTTSMQKEKQELIFNHYLQHIGTYVPRTCSLNLTELEWQERDLQHLDLPFSEQEIKNAIMNSPKEKAPGPDGYIGLFFAKCWEIIKEDIIRAMDQFYVLNQQGMHLMNHAYVVLIPKVDNPQKVNDYRPISLIHSFAKLVSKLLAARLAPELDHLISANQTAFIRKRSIHDNFVFVQEVIKDLHRRKIPSLFIKLDISKAFDTVNWPYLLQILSHLGFGQRWRDWIANLWCSASSSFLINGQPGKKILHCREVRQGDPLSPMLFLLAMEPLD
jgi:hypothetical protein